MNEYQKTIGITYYNENYFNVGVAASNNLGNHNEKLKIVLLNGLILNSTINRTNNQNGSVRFYGGLEWNNFITDNYNLNDVIKFQVNNPSTITILPNAQ
jgi:hypothetical protein